MGLFVDFETGYRVTPSKAPVAGAPDHYWVHHFSMRTKDRTPIDLEKVGGQLERAFPRIWTGESENDGFNRLIMSLGASWREAALIRALCRYRKQTGLDPAQGTQILALSRHTQITALILDLFTARFDPDSDVDLDTRQETCRTLMEQIETELEAVESLDEDRVLRRIATLIMGILRTNFYQRAPHETPGEVITFKIAPRELDYLPNPRPYREIFVWAPHVEGVHLRFGPVARGGLRWSDRRDDFRTEVLGLVKAQQVKNAVIVPVGSKGGFVPKKLPAGGDRDAVREEGIRAYKTFITGLLRLTDNLVDGKIVQPKRVVCWDDPDPYLVVAADKGTATFSDIANGISLENGFWLGDAFASGGSAGYDHKKMGITARGGWVAVQRHFRERGKDIQTEPFNVVGVGDMSGDVFGNGMLLSKTIRLVAAFNHLDVFIDPDPIDAARNWEERKRLFDLPRSSWQDYDQSLISKGGGVFSRSAKSIPLSPEIKALTGLEADRLPPNDLIRALLKLDVELLWFGGIGTYVKARSESHLDVGDKANDGLRVDAADLSARVIGEGANLGITQAARIEFARAGGAVNTDAVDNSAGVDSSDHEVNIKILLADAIRNGNLAEADRNDLLAEMTDDVAAHVLANNYSQTAALSVAVASAGVDLDAHQRFMERLERTGELDRVVEGLPGSEEVRELRERGLGLSRPEIAVLLAYAKNTLFDQLIETDIPDDPHFEATLRAYFPEQIHRFETALGQHRLRREIICTYLVNRIINLGGPTFVHRVQESADASVADIARAFETARVVFRTDDFLRDVNALDNQAPAAVQTELKRELIRILRRQAFWLARTRRGQEPVGDMIARYQGGIDALKPVIATSISAFEQDRLADRQARFEKGGAPTDIAREAATLQVLSSATDLVDLSEQAGLDVVPAARAYHLVGARCHFDVLRAAAGEAASSEHWDRLATRRLIEDLLRQQFDVTHTALMATGLTGSEAGKTDIETVETRITDWLDGIGEGLTRLDRSVQELEQSGSWTFAKLVLVSDSIRIFVSDLKAEGATP